MRKLAIHASAVLFLLATSVIAQENAPLTVTISGVHICCKGCVNAIDKAVAKLPEVKSTVSQDDGTVILTANNPKKLQEAVDAIAAAGFSGTSDSEEVKFKPIEFKEGNVRKLEVAHIHNCCKMCTDAIQGAIEAVPGVKSNTLKNKQVSFVVEGDFSPADVVKAIQEAGFYPTIKGREAKKEPTAGT